MAEAVPSAAGFNFLNWLEQPGSQNLLAGIGAKLDPNGVGAALGTATIGYNQSRVAAARADANEKKLDTQRAEALKLLGLTPPGSPGPTKVEVKKDGNIIQTSDVGTSTVPAPAASTQAPGSGVLLPTEPVTAAPPITGSTGDATAPIAMPVTTVTAQREPVQAAAADPYARNVGNFDVRRIAPFS